MVREAVQTEVREAIQTEVREVVQPEKKKMWVGNERSVVACPAARPARLDVPACLESSAAGAPALMSRLKVPAVASHLACPVRSELPVRSGFRARLGFLAMARLEVLAAGALAVRSGFGAMGILAAVRSGFSPAATRATGCQEEAVAARLEKVAPQAERARRAKAATVAKARQRRSLLAAGSGPRQSNDSPARRPDLRRLSGRIPSRRAPHRPIVGPPPIETLTRNLVMTTCTARRQNRQEESAIPRWLAARQKHPSNLFGMRSCSTLCASWSPRTPRDTRRSKSLQKPQARRRRENS